MEQADLEQVIAIDQKSFTLPWPVSSFQYELAHNDTSRCWVAEVEIEGKRRIAAMAVAWLILDEVHVATIAVEPEYRRMKIGQKLLIAILKDAQASGARHAFLEVRETNLAARKMYLKLGFEEAGKRPHYYSDTQEDAILMNLDTIDAALLEWLD